MDKDYKFEIEKIMEHICCILDENLTQAKYLQECFPLIYKVKYGNSDHSYKKALLEYKDSLNPSELLKYKEIETRKSYLKIK